MVWQGQNGQRGSENVGRHGGHKAHACHWRATGPWAKPPTSLSSGSLRKKKQRTKWASGGLGWFWDYRRRVWESESCSQRKWKWRSGWKMTNEVGGQEEETLDSWTLAHVPPTQRRDTPKGEGDRDAFRNISQCQWSHSKRRHKCSEDEGKDVSICNKNRSAPQDLRSQQHLRKSICDQRDRKRTQARTNRIIPESCTVRNKARQPAGHT